MPLPIGTVLDGKFKIVGVLGEGGMGTVYKVEQIGTPSFFYAVKELTIPPNTSEEDRKAAIERFNKEIVLLRGLKHEHIASLAVSFQERGNYYFVMEFVPGRSLEKILEDSKGPLDEDQVIHWMMQVCEALSYIHSRTPPIILRDLKPGNIMITPDNEVQLIDFGIARIFDPNKRTNTENLGTISYASPEHLGSITAPGQRRSPQNPGRLVQTDARSDVYSLGATMYHLLTNHEPEPIQTPPSGSIYAKNPRLRTVQIGNRVICPIEQVIIKAMQQDPAQRFQSAEAMRMALQHCLPNQDAINRVPTTVQIPAISPNATVVVPATPLICPKCHFQNRPVAKFCKNCGQPLTAGATLVPPRVAAQATARAPIRARPVQPANSSTVSSINRPVQPARPIQARPVQAPNPAGAYRLGLQYLNSKNYIEAINQFKLAQSYEVPGRPSYDVSYNLGRAYRQYAQSVKDKDKHLFTENLKFAIEEFEQAAKARPDALDAYFQLGMCYHDLALYPQSVAAFKNALKIAPTDPAIYYQLGRVSMDQGYSREAEAYFLEGLKINPDHALILVALGRLYIQMNQSRAAISVLQQATQREPALWEGWYELGRAHMKAKEWKLALSALEQARQQSPETAEIYSAMASCYLRTNKKAEARQMVRECLSRDPNSIEGTRLQKQLS
jgi:serine/threonine protein kinase/cytochrome c-type biogenesis protein CcmH/NrfG